MDTLTNLSADVLRYAVARGIVDSPIDHILSGILPADELGEVPAEMFDYVTSSPADVINPNEENLFEHPKSRRLQETVFAPLDQPDQAEFWAVELSRIVVPEGQVGFLDSIEQVLLDSTGDYYPTNAAYWGSPYFVDAEVAACRWYLTIDFFDGLQPLRYNTSGTTLPTISQLPGFPYPDLNTIDGIWYPAHSAASSGLKLIIPGQRMLRFFFVTPPTVNYTWRAAGRLRAFTQSTYSCDSASNARRTY